MKNFSSSYTEYEQYLYDLAIESVSVSERLRHLLHSKVELISLKKLFTRTGHFHTGSSLNSIWTNASCWWRRK